MKPFLMWGGIAAITLYYTYRVARSMRGQPIDWVQVGLLIAFVAIALIGVVLNNYYVFASAYLVMALGRTRVA